MIPFTIEARRDTGVTNVTMGIWLFLSSEVMLFGALFSAYALLRTSALAWPRGGDVLNVPLGAANTVVLLVMTAFAWRARQSTDGRRQLGYSSLLAVAFLVVKGFEYRSEFSRGLAPADSTFLATYFTLTGLHALHVVGGLAANLWAITGVARVGTPMTAGRIRALGLYWTFVDVVWCVIFVLCYLT